MLLKLQHMIVLLYYSLCPDSHLLDTLYLSYLITDALIVSKLKKTSTHRYSIMQQYLMKLPSSTSQKGSKIF